MSEEITEAEAHDLQGVAVALLRASQLGDEPGFDAVLETVETLDAYKLAALLVGMLNAVATATVGAERWQAECAAWMPGRKLGSNLLGPGDGPAGRQSDLDWGL